MSNSDEHNANAGERPVPVSSLPGSVSHIHVTPLRISTEGDASPAEDPCRIVAEAPLNIDIDSLGVYTIMCTPGDAEALAMGFMFSEGIIDSREDVAFLKPCADSEGLVRVNLRDTSRAQSTRRNLDVVSSCGLCGSEDLDRLLAGLSPVDDTMRIPAWRLREASAALRARQKVFAETGGTHGAGIFNGHGEMIAVAEDVGRHSALDKAVGMCLLEEEPFAGCGVALSGRVSLELVMKCVRAKLEVMAAVSAPTSLAVEVAERFGVTLCAFVRDTRATVFTHPHRIEETGR